MPPGARRAATSSPSSPRAPRTTGRRSTRSRPAPRASRSARGRPEPTDVAHRAGGPHVPRQGGAAVLGPGAVRAPDRARRRAPPAPSDDDDADAVRQLTAVIDRGIRDGQPRLPRRGDGARPRPGGAGRAQQPDDPDPSLEARADLARRLGRSAPERPGRGAPRRRSLPHHPRRAAPHRRATSSPRPTRRACSARRSGSRCWSWSSAASSPPPRSINVWPAALVVLVSLLVKTPVSKGTARVLVGLVAFPAAWITAGVLAADGAARRSPSWCSPPRVGALAAVWMVERAMALAVDAAALAGAARADRHRRPGRGGARRRGRHRPGGRPDRRDRHAGTSPRATARRSARA